MSTISVEGNLRYQEEDSSDEDDEHEGEGRLEHIENYRPTALVSKPQVHDTLDSDEEQLEVFSAPSNSMDKSFATDYDTAMNSSFSANPNSNTSTYGSFSLTRDSDTSMNDSFSENADSGNSMNDSFSAYVKKSPPPKKSLVDLMASAVASVESEILETSVIDTEMSHHSFPIAPPAQTPTDLGGTNFVASSTSGEITHSEREEVVTSETFGITYQPFKKKNPEYEMPKGPAFQDEAEFERELETSGLLFSSSASQPSSTIDDDDEFGFDVVPLVSSVSPSGSSTIREAVRRAAERATAEARAEEEARLHEIKIAAAAAAVVHIDDHKHVEDADSFLTPASMEVAATDTKYNVHQAAKNSMSHIAGLYGVGHGDIDTNLLDEITDLNARPSPSQKHQLSIDRANHTIVEADEEEEEEAEKEEEIRLQEHNRLDRAMQSELERAWDSVESDEGGRELGRKDGPVIDGVDPRIEYDAALAYLRSTDLSPYLASIVTQTYEESPSDGIGGWLASKFTLKPPNLNFPGSEQELQLPFLLAQLDYDYNNVHHLRIMSSLYWGLLQADESDYMFCPVFGPHWDNIGFQGIDVCTDVNRSMKMLAVLQAFHLVSHVPVLAELLHALSRHGMPSTASGLASLKPTVPTTSSAAVRVSGQLDLSWPFMCVSILLTKEALQALRRGALNKQINTAKSVLKVLHDFHHACFLNLGRRLVADPSRHHALHIADLRSEIQSNSAGILKSFYKLIPDTDISPAAPSTAAIYSLLSHRADATVVASKKSNSAPVSKGDNAVAESLSEGKKSAEPLASFHDLSHVENSLLMTEKEAAEARAKELQEGGGAAVGRKAGSGIFSSLMVGKAARFKS